MAAGYQHGTYWDFPAIARRQGMVRAMAKPRCTLALPGLIFSASLESNLPIVETNPCSSSLQSQNSCWFEVIWLPGGYLGLVDCIWMYENPKCLELESWIIPGTYYVRRYSCQKWLHLYTSLKSQVSSQHLFLRVKPSETEWNRVKPSQSPMLWHRQVVDQVVEATAPQISSTGARSPKLRAQHRASPVIYCTKITMQILKWKFSTVKFAEVLTCSYQQLAELCWTSPPRHDPSDVLPWCHVPSTAQLSAMNEEEPPRSRRERRDLGVSTARGDPWSFRYKPQGFEVEQPGHTTFQLPQLRPQQQQQCCIRTGHKPWFTSRNYYVVSAAVRT